MKPHILPLLAFLLWQDASQAQLIGRSYGAKPLALGGISSLSDNGFETINNPALLANGAENSVSLFQETPYLQKDLGVSGISYQRKNTNFSQGICLIQSGNSYFKQQLLAFALAKKLSEHLYLGAALHYQVSYQFQLQTQYNLMGALGLLLHLKKNWTFSSCILNLNAARNHLKIEPSPITVMRFGCAYKVNDNLNFLAEQEQILGSQGQLKLGMSIRFDPKFDLYLGLNKSAQLYSFACSYQTKKTRSIVGASVHAVLGISPYIEFQYLPFSSKK